MRHSGAGIVSSFRQILPALGVCILFALFTKPAFAQNEDSLQSLLKTAKTIERQFELNELLTQSYEDKGGDKVVLEASAEMVRLAILSGNDSLKQLAFFNYGHVCEDNTDFKGAIVFFFKALKLAEARKDTFNACIILVNIGLVFKTLYNGPEALHYLNQAERYLSWKRHRPRICLHRFIPKNPVLTC